MSDELFAHVTSSAGNGGVGTANANGGSVSLGSIDSGGNTGGAIGVGNSWGGVTVTGETDTNNTSLGVSANGGTGIADASGGNYNLAFTSLATDRATIGAYQSRMNFTSEQLTVSKENLSAASSRIQDVDVAEESTQYARYNILVQSGTAMLAQANQVPQSALRLLQ